MREPRVYLDSALRADDRLPLPEATFRHLVQVLRLANGARLSVFDGRGCEHRATLDGVGKRGANVLLGEPVGTTPESPLRLTLVQAVSKGDRMDYTLQKAVELGVTGIQPLVTDRSVVRLDAERQARKREHWMGVVISACEQSGRATVPELLPLREFGDWIASPGGDSLRLTLDPRAEAGFSALPRAQRVMLLVGPEGGLSQEEIRAAFANGFTGVRMGPRVLRTETAGVAALAALQALWGDLG